MPLACRVQWSWADRTGDTVKQSQRRVTSPVIGAGAILLMTRSKMFRQHLKCSLTAPRCAGTSSGFFFLFLFTQPAVWAWETWYSARCLGQPVDLLAPWPSAAVIPRQRSTAVHFQSVERRVQRNLEGLANVRLDELTVVRRHRLFFLVLTQRRRGLGERGDKILRWRHSNCTHFDACRRERAWVFPETLQKCEQEDWAAVSGSEDRTVQTRPVSSRSVHHGIFPDVYFYTKSLQRPHQRRPMASRREQVSALFFVAWTQRRLTECFP